MEAAASLPGSGASPPSTASPAGLWSGGGDQWLLTLAGGWRGHPAALPPLPAAMHGSLAFQAQSLADWDAHLAASVWQRLNGLPARSIRIDLSGLPRGLQQILSLALPDIASTVTDAPSRPGPAQGVPAVAAAPASAATTQSPAGPASPAEGPPRETWLKAKIRLLGRSAAQPIEQARITLAFLGDVVLSLGRLLRGRTDMRLADLAWQVDQTGPRSVPIVVLVSLLVSLIIAYMGAAQLQRFGAQVYIADLATVSVVRELAALVTGIILAGRVGAAFAAQIGSMRANEEIDALQTLGIDPVDFLVLPRVLALLIVGPLLTVIAALSGLLISWAVAVFIYGVSPLAYVFSSLQAMTLPHMLIGLLKGSVYALLVALAGCRQGLAAGRSAQAVGDATTAAVVQAIVWMVIAASTLTVIFQRLDW